MGKLIIFGSYSEIFREIVEVADAFVNSSNRQT